jgi:hypothetical protein
MTSTQILINIGLAFLTIFIFGGILAFIKGVFKSIIDKINTHDSDLSSLRETSIKRIEFDGALHRMELKLDNYRIEQKENEKIKISKFDKMNESLLSMQQAIISSMKK